MRVMLASAIVGAPALLSAQQESWDVRRLYATRDSLRVLLDRYEAAASSPAYSGRLRDQARGDAARIRARLEQGDFQVGDRIVLEVEEEEVLSDTFTVETGPDLRLPMAGVVALAGVLRSELQQHLRTHIGRFVRDPVLRARTLIRVSIVGEVTTPGFYVVATEGLITDALMLAGGPTRDAFIERMRIERESDAVWEGPALQTAITEGRTLDIMNIRAGDRIVIPRHSSGLGGAEGAVRVVSLILSIPLTIFAVTQIF